jgi:hypothetical protein
MGQKSPSLTDRTAAVTGSGRKAGYVYTVGFVYEWVLDSTTERPSAHIPRCTINGESATLNQGNLAAFAPGRKSFGRTAE